MKNATVKKISVPQGRLRGVMMCLASLRRLLPGDHA
jgi:hypothetical protein